MGTEPVPASWSDFFSARREIHGRYGSIWEVPLLRKRASLVLPLARPGLRVLDVGAGEQDWRERLSRAAPDLSYRAVEADPRRPGDFSALSAAGGEYDLVLFLEVIEHLPFEEGLASLKRIRSLLSAGGHLVASTPNVFHPSRYLEDATHRTPYSHECLGGALRMAGFSRVDLWRAYNASVLERALRRLAIPLHRLLGVDYARTIFAVAQK